MKLYTNLHRFLTGNNPENIDERYFIEAGEIFRVSHMDGYSFYLTNVNDTEYKEIQVDNRMLTLGFKENNPIGKSI